MTPDVDEYVANWQRGDDHALLRYCPNPAGKRDPAARLILRFKDRYAAAITAVAGYAVDWIGRHEALLRDEMAVRYVIVAPRSSASQANVACELLAAALAAEFVWLRHMPEAVVRTVTVPPAHLGGPRLMETHLKTMRYAGSSLSGGLTGLRCEFCDAEFVDQVWLRRHLAGARHRQMTATKQKSAVLLLDDVITTGATSRAVRELLQRDGDAGRVIGLFVGRTRRDDGAAWHAGEESAPPPAAEVDRQRWGILFDLDGTLVDSSAISDLREQRAWSDASAAFGSTSTAPTLRAMLEEMRRLGAVGVVTSAPRPYARALLRHHDLSIPLLVAFHDTEHHKPHPEPLLKAAAMLKVRPEHTIYIGDQPEDLEAATLAGARGIAYGGGWGLEDLAGIRAADWHAVSAAVRQIVRG